MEHLNSKTSLATKLTAFTVLLLLVTAIFAAAKY